MKLHDPPRDVHPQWYEAPTFYFTNPHSSSARTTTSRCRPAARVFDYELEVAAVIGRDGRDLDARGAPPATSSATRSSTTGRPRPAVRRDAGRARPGQGQGLRHHARPVDRHRRRARAVPARRLPRLQMEVSVNGEHARRRHAREHGLVVRGARRLRLARHLGPPGDVLGSGTCGGGCLGELWGTRGQAEPPPLAPATSSR